MQDSKAAPAPSPAAQDSIEPKNFEKKGVVGVVGGNKNAKSLKTTYN